MDTGAESNILGLEALEQILQVSKEKITPLGYNLSLRGTTGLRNNAILGRVTVNLSFLLAIRFFGTEDYWFLGTIELGRSENDIKSLGRWVTGSLDLWVTRSLGH